MAECGYIASDYYLVAIGCMAVLVGTQWSAGLAGNSAGGALDFHRWCDISVHDGDTVAYAPYVQPAEGGYILCDVARVETGEVFEHVALLGGDMPVDLLPREHGARLFPDATAFRPVQKMAVADRLSGRCIERSGAYSRIIGLDYYRLLVSGDVPNVDSEEIRVLTEVVTPGKGVLYGLLSYLSTVALFLFTNTIFKKHKVLQTLLWTWLISFAINLVCTPIMGAIVLNGNWVEAILQSVDPVRGFNIAYWAATAWGILLTVVFLWWTAYRLKRMKY